MHVQMDVLAELTADRMAARQQIASQATAENQLRESLLSLEQTRDTLQEQLQASQDHLQHQQETSAKLQAQVAAGTAREESLQQQLDRQTTALQAVQLQLEGTICVV